MLCGIRDNTRKYKCEKQDNRFTWFTNKLAPSFLFVAGPIQGIQQHSCLNCRDDIKVGWGKTNGDKAYLIRPAIIGKEHAYFFLKLCYT